MQSGGATSEGTKHALTWYFPKEPKTHIHTKACVGRFTAPLFITAKTQKQPRCPPVDEQITVVHPDKGILFSTQKKWSAKPPKDMEAS